MTRAAFTYFPEIALRGDRNYVHSTDIYEEVIAGTRAADLAFTGPIDFRMRVKIARRPRFSFFPGAGDLADTSATCRFCSSGRIWTAAVTPSDEKVRARKEYDEEPVALLSTIQGNVANLDGETGLRPIEAVTALAVHLHKSAVPPTAGRRWMLGRLAIKRPLTESDARHLTLKIDRAIGTTTTRTTIHAIDGNIGIMQFVLA